mmetsp:Transcript_25041/g.48709  ORF Transcript_25041/g.48709 Transcript_25041/m.48709 type:complete len:437 (+) Transcript_25041:67-1377(+)
MLRMTVATLLFMALLGMSTAGGVLSKIAPGKSAGTCASTDTVGKVTDSFTKTYGEEPKFIFAAPGRVNLIGEHTDYNDGFVMPCAIDYHMVCAISPSDDDTITAVAADFDCQPNKFSLSDPIVKAENKEDFWSNYVRGVCKVLKEDRGLPLRGAKIVIGGDVPQGAGLSSSAALEVSVGTALNAVMKLGLGPKEVALTGQSAEHWVGCNCGIMDQLISACGEAGHSLLIDCRDLSTYSVKIPKGTSIVIVNSNFKHHLAGLDSEYNQRRSQCEEAAQHFGVSHLRDVSIQDLLKEEKALDPQTFRRARHVVTENDRTEAARKALEKGDLVKMGKLMAESHVSMKDDFEITVPPIDGLVSIIGKVIGDEGGVRMTGGGFGGSVVCLCKDDKVEAVKKAVEEQYPALSGGLKATIIVTTAVQGAGTHTPGLKKTAQVG